MSISLALNAATLKRSRASIATYRNRAEKAALDNPAVSGLVRAHLAALKPENGLQMAQARGRAQLPQCQSIDLLTHLTDSRRSFISALTATMGSPADWQVSMCGER